MADIEGVHENGGVVSSGHVASVKVMDDVKLSAEVTEDTSANCNCTLSRNFASMRSELRQEIASRDVLLQKLEESITRMAEELSLKECSKTKMEQEIRRDVESLQAETSSEGLPQEAETEEQEKIIIRNRCIEALMSATEILENNVGKTSHVKGWFEKIYDTAPETSYILRILENYHSMTIFIDCGSDHIGRLINRLVNHDGNKVHGTELPAFTDFMHCKVYAAGMPKKWLTGNRYVYSHPIAVLAECLTQFAMSVIFKNRGCPYAYDDKLMEEVYERIMLEALSEQSEIKKLSYSFQRAHGMQTQIGKEVMFISAIPAYLVEYGLRRVMSHPNVQLYFHYLFFKQHFVPKMMDYLRE